MADSVVDAPACRLVSVTSADDRVLHGALYEPQHDAVAALLHLHGKGGNFYSGPSRFLPAHLRDAPFRHLSLNLRSHDLAYTRDDVPYRDFESGSTEADGGYWEDLETGDLDIGAGIDLLTGLGDVPLFVAGHSAGGFYAAMQSATDRRVAGQILMSSVIDNKRALRFWFPQPGELRESRDRARRMVEAGQGRTLMPLRHWYYAISATTLLQRAAEPDRRWNDAIARTDAPTLLLWGERETRADLWNRLYEELPVPRKRRAVIPDCGHDYLGGEQTVAEEVARFVVDVVAGEL